MTTQELPFQFLRAAISATIATGSGDLLIRCVKQGASAMPESLADCFPFSKTPEGEKFWQAVADATCIAELPESPSYFGHIATRHRNQNTRHRSGVRESVAGNAAYLLEGHKRKY